jgi:MerR family transcriptional regulator, redox-sensitive transcriptional activator SoxR
VTQLTIGQLAERAGVATSAIRFYEEKGLVHSTRTTGNQRRYAQSTLRRVAFVRAAQRVGLSLEEVAEALATLPDHRTPTKADWHRISRDWKPRLEDQIRRIRLLERRLDSCIGCGCLSLKSCSLMNPGDVAGEQGGKGAVLLEP